MKTLTTIAGTGLLLIGGIAYAQDIPAPATAPAPQAPAATDPAIPSDESPTSDPTLPPEAMPAPGSSTTDTMPATGSTNSAMPQHDTMTMPQHDGTETVDSSGTMSTSSFTDDQIKSFATAALQIQDLQGDAASKQTQAAKIVADSGLDAKTFNAIGSAMQSDPDVAKRVQLAATDLKGSSQPQPEG